MLLQLVVVLVSLHVGTAHKCTIVAVDQDQLREEFRTQVSVTLEQMATNVSIDHQVECGIEGKSLRNEISEQTNTTLEFIAESNENTVEELKLIIRALENGLKEVSETVETTVTEAVDKAVSAAVETTVTQAVDRAVNTAVETTVSTAVETTVSTAVKTAVKNATNLIEQLLQSLLNDTTLLKMVQLGRTSSNPASSCAEILATDLSTPSGYYWLRASNGSSVRAYCDMTRTCGGITGGWMQVANTDVTNRDHTCPQGLRTVTTPKRMCGRTTSSPGCSSAIFNVHGIEYTRVCGKIIGYQDKSTDAFAAYYYNRALTIDNTYLDGVSLTHGSNPRKHIWSFAAAVDETNIFTIAFRCPCIYRNRRTAFIPPWVGTDYFCDTAAEELYQLIFYPDDPLWDGEGCGPTSTCCSFNNPPWFSKQLPSPTTDDIEMRLCVNEPIDNEDITVEKVNLYVQ